MLNTEILVNEIRKISDPKFRDFEGFPRSREEAASRWSMAFFKYSMGLYPIPKTTGLAKEIMRKRLLSVDFSDDVLIMEKAVTEFANQLAIGMLPEFAAISPAVPLSYKSAYNRGFMGGTAREVASMLATITTEWFTKGTAINTTTKVELNWR